MLKFKELGIDNFGPYKEHQSIVVEDGVNIMWGNNGRGKTTLLNAFRFVLFGKVYGRDAENAHSLAEVSNWESAKEGRYGFKVSLKMEYDGIDYTLTRIYSLKNDVTHPQSDEDYTEFASLKRNNSILSDIEMQQALGAIMPENISRFFLFDGELLSEYEDLLRDNKSIGLKIKESIENILGVPILTNGLASIDEASDRFSKKLTEELKKDNKNQQLAMSLATLQEKADQLKIDLASLKATYKDTDDKRKGLDALVRKSERTNKLLEKIDYLEKDLSKLLNDEKISSDILKGMNRNLWLSYLDGTIKHQIMEIDEQIVEIKQKESEASVRAVMKATLREGLQTGNCPICKQSITASQMETLISDINIGDSGKLGLTEAESANLSTLIAHRSILTMDSEIETVKSIKLASEALSKIRSSIAQDKQEILDTKSQLVNVSGMDEIKNNTLELAKCLAELELISQSISVHENDILEVQKKIKDLEDKIGKNSSGVNLTKIKRLKETAEKLKNIFTKGRDLYTLTLKTKIEEDATTLFKCLSSEPEYDRLKINDSYGLNIVHNDGSIISIKAAGYMHIVSLCLIGALQKNAPMQGPVIIDSPFGRLDSVNTKRLTESLDKLSHEVIVLLYDNEMNAQDARSSLKEKLVKEYSLERISSRNTRIVEGGYDG